MAEDLIQWDGGALVADMLQDASITDASELTRFAIEDGSTISDHIIRQPRRLSVTLVQTETPISETTGFLRALQALTYQTRPEGKQTNTVPVRQSEFRPAPLLALSTGIQSLLFGLGAAKELSVTGLASDRALSAKEIKVHVLSAAAPIDRVNDFHGQLLSLLESGTPVIVTIKGNSYLDLVLTSVTRTDASGQVGKATFGVELEQVATVETKVVNLPPVPKSKGPKQLGARPAVQATPEQQEEARASFEVFTSQDEELFSSEPGP